MTINGMLLSARLQIATITNRPRGRCHRAAGRAGVRERFEQELDSADLGFRLGEADHLEDLLPSVRAWF